MTSPTTLTDAIRNAVLYQLMNIHTAFPGKVISYDYTQKKAVIQPQINKKYTDGTVQAMPILNNVPVIFPFASGASITFPVNEGDYCLVLCCERSIDEWLTTARQAAPNDPRKLDISDAVAIMGLLPFTETSPADNNTDFLISYQGSKIRIKENGAIVIQTSDTVAIGSQAVELLQTLITLLNSFTAFSGSDPYPTVATAALAAIADLTSIQGTIP